jgi:hypothetical protein
MLLPFLIAADVLHDCYEIDDKYHYRINMDIVRNNYRRLAGVLLG